VTDVQDSAAVINGLSCYTVSCICFTA